MSSFVPYVVSDSCSLFPLVQPADVVLYASNSFDFAVDKVVAPPLLRSAAAGTDSAPVVVVAVVVVVRVVV